MSNSKRMLQSIGVESVPDGWEWKRIKECFDIIKRRNENNCENILTISSLSGFVNQKERFSKVIAGENLKKYTLLLKDEFAYNKGNSKTFPCGCIFLLKDYEEAAIPNVYISFKGKDNIYNRFYEYYFQNKLLDGQLRRLINTGVRNDGLLNINTNEFSEVYIPESPIKEQEKIAEILSTWDLAIDKQQQLIEKKKEFKKGLMQRLLSGEVRFKSEIGEEYPDWKLVELGDYLIKHNEKSEYNGQYPVLTSSRKGIFLQSEYYSGNDVASDDTTGYNVVPRGYFTYRHMSDDLIFKFNINDIVDKGIVSTLYPVFTVKDMDPYFLRTKLNEGNEFKRFALSQKQGGSRTYMYFSKLEKLKVNIPSLEEQKKISEVLKTADKEIELLEKELEALKLQKKGLMQRLLTGEVRVNVE